MTKEWFAAIEHGDEGQYDHDEPNDRELEAATNGTTMSLEQLRSVVGQAIRAIRKDQGLSQFALGVKAGIYPGNLSRIENAQGPVPNLRTLSKIAEALNVEVVTFFLF